MQKTTCIVLNNGNIKLLSWSAGSRAKTMSVPNDRLSDENQDGKSVNDKQNQDHMWSQTLEQGNILFFCRPKLEAREVTGIDDMTRFFKVLWQMPGSLTKQQTERITLELRIKDRVQYRGQVSWSNECYHSPYMVQALHNRQKIASSSIQKPDCRKGTPKVGGIFYDPKDLTNERYWDQSTEREREREGDSGRLLVKAYML